ncbi:hypothetical protein LOD99_11 [Oopsacas minuta]|uniref:Cilia-and flagella-associated protein 96 n=1 Tax=Oopsacas minuta TaxID=111878 RepID=A0AAV7K9B8_9METZ|nr:hypothetical protein LOD99_11 [Oopsacas minuta]
MNEKRAMERIGLFSEPGYTTISDPYGKKEAGFRGKAPQDKGLKPLQIPGCKTRTATLGGYFAERFDRIMEGEAHTDPIKRKRQDRLKEKKKQIIEKPFIPSNPPAKYSGTGSGTFSGKIEAFPGSVRSKPPYSAPGKNFQITPGKRGTGYGYVGVAIGAEFKYMESDYEAAKQLRHKETADHKSKLKGQAFKLFNHPQTLFDRNPYRQDKSNPPEIEYKPSEKERPKPFLPSTPAKDLGGSKAGTFDKYPSHSEDLYQLEKTRKDQTKRIIFHPSGGPKTKPSGSLVSQNVMKSVNVNNFRTVQSVMSH